GTLEEPEVGHGISVGDGIARVSGLAGAMLSEMLAFTGGLFGIALNLEEEHVSVVLLGESSHIKEGDVVRRTGRPRRARSREIRDGCEDALTKRTHTTTGIMSRPEPAPADRPLTRARWSRPVVRRPGWRGWRSRT